MLWSILVTGWHIIMLRLHVCSFTSFIHVIHLGHRLAYLDCRYTVVVITILYVYYILYVYVHIVCMHMSPVLLYKHVLCYNMQYTHQTPFTVRPWSFAVFTREQASTTDTPNFWWGWRHIDSNKGVWNVPSDHISVWITHHSDSPETQLTVGCPLLNELAI